MTPLDPGPYCNEDGDWWVPVEAIHNRMKAAHEVRMCADPLAVIRYEGMVTTNLTPHDIGCDCGKDCVRPVVAWHFTEEHR